MTDQHFGIALVLGARVRPNGSASPSLRRRAEAAVRLWHDGRVAVILASGASPEGLPSEAQVIAQICRAAGVPPEALWLDAQARTTEENLRQAARMIRTAHPSEAMPGVVLVTDLYHQPRARLVARRLGLRARSVWPPLRGALAWPFLKASLREIPALVWYWIAGKGRPPRA